MLLLVYDMNKSEDQSPCVTRKCKYTTNQSNTITLGKLNEARFFKVKSSITKRNIIIIIITKNSSIHYKNDDTSNLTKTQDDRFSMTWKAHQANQALHAATVKQHILHSHIMVES